jgi:16S rRNA (adenine1518-N6/adenine1519-N6)-dimethyltransferase
MQEKSFQKKKSLGQNFLRSTAVVRAMVKAGEVKEGDVVLEIGPGKGVLTKVLLETGAKVFAIEKDNRLIPVLEETFKNELASKQLTLAHDDILNTDIKKILGSSASKYKVVANIPYYITGQLFRIFLESENQPSVMVVLVQKEVAQRIVAHDKKESILSMSIKAYGTPKVIQKVSRKLFSPEPNVDSAVLLISNISKDFFKDISEKEFFEIVKKAFSQKRKQLGKSLKNIFGENTQQIFEVSKIETTERPEKLAIKDWEKLVLARANVIHNP